jgi:hypothetical protein
VLPRISAALSKFIAPISSTAAQLQIKPHKDDGFRRHSDPNRHAKKDHKPPQKQPEEAPPDNVTELHPARPLLTNSNTGVTQALLKLLAKLQIQRGIFSRWFGPKTYETAIKNQKQSGKFRKGAMLDTKAE